jgi:signal transduction histidine kinase
MELEFETVDLNLLLEEAIEMVGARRTGSACRISLPRPLPSLLCDPLRVREIYSNLLSNAMKYKRGDEARIELGFIAADQQGARPEVPLEAAGHTVFYVSDQGIGIEPRHHAQVFRLFKRLHGRDEYGGGAGAGLTIVQKLVQRHGGCVWLESVPGAGSSFYFTLPGMPGNP